MPEIKHNFTGGKMNKDLDERLIPNGQYRDAMNVQVSTSEGSDVGTVQNILGNGDPIQTSSFIGDNAFCVGSISDEKNDKLYYFIRNLGADIEVNGNFEGTQTTETGDSGWKLGGITQGGAGWKVVNNKLSAFNTSAAAYYNSNSPELELGKTYTVTYTISNMVTNGASIRFNLYGQGTSMVKGTNRSDNGTFSEKVTITNELTGLLNKTIQFIPSPADNGDGFYGKISKVSIKEDYGSVIMQYSNTPHMGNKWWSGQLLKNKIIYQSNSSIPVFVDLSNNILQFDTERLITGINIIDGMLFWTDNYSEPKKININRSINGTAIDGTEHTKIINDAQNLGVNDGSGTFNEKPVEEEHITVIKKYPKKPPKLTYETFRDPDKTYSGVITISDHSGNANSFISSSIGDIYDFSFIEVGDYFRVNIDTDIEGSNEFTLDWKNWMPVVIKEFNSGEAPAIPLANYTIKGAIYDWSGNEFNNSGLEVSTNGDFELNPIGNGWEGAIGQTMGTSWHTPTQEVGWQWDSINKIMYTAKPTIIGTGATHPTGNIGGYRHANFYQDVGFEAGKRYQIDFDVLPPHDNSNLEGRLWVTVHNNTAPTPNSYSSWSTYPNPPCSHAAIHSGEATAGSYSYTLTIRDEPKWNSTEDDVLAYDDGYKWWPWWWAANNAYNSGIAFHIKDYGSAEGPNLVNISTSSSVGVTMTGGASGYPTPTIGALNSGFNFGIGSQPNVVEFVGSGLTNNVFIFGGTAGGTYQLNNITNGALEKDKEYNFEFSYVPATGSPTHQVNSVQLLGRPNSTSTTKSIVEVDGSYSAIGGVSLAVFAPTFSGTTFSHTGTFKTSDSQDCYIYIKIGGMSVASMDGIITIVISDPSEKIWFNGSIDNVSVKEVDDVQARVGIRVDSISGTPPSVPQGETELKYVIDKFDSEDKIFEDKLPRFSYRYKYSDGEYSAFSPFTEAAFVPSTFDYHPKKGYNIGMSNNLKSVTLDVSEPIPEDITSIDFLYKEENSPNIYIVDTIKDLSNLTYKVSGKSIRNGLTGSNQLLRPWDNVPRKALAQDVVGNRVVYGNYLQNYDLKDNANGSNFTPDISINLNSTKNFSRIGRKSIKSLREYQIGITYLDKYGRETPILTSPDATFKVNKSAASEINQVEVSLLNEGHPVNMKYFKFYIKDTGGEYYNLAMDRFYDADDDNVWLAFPSVDRNKVSIGDFITLKKGVGNITKEEENKYAIPNLIHEKAEYKILDIKNEAPSYIKRKETLILKRKHNPDVSTDNIFVAGNLPTEGDVIFKIDHNKLNYLPAGNLHDTFNQDAAADYYVSLSNDDTKRHTDKYKIIELNVNNNKWRIQLEKPWDNEVNYFSDDPSGENPSKVLNNTYVNIYRVAEDKSASAKFDGRFFVKIYNDDIFTRTMKKKINDEDLEYKSIGVERKIYSLETLTDYNPRLKKHVNSTGATTEAFKDIETDSGRVGFNTKAATVGPNSQITWAHYNNVTCDWGEKIGTLNGRRSLVDLSATYSVAWRSISRGITNHKEVWRDYDAYFRGINIHLDDDALTNRRDNIDIHGDNAEDQTFEDVWFIDKAVSEGNFKVSSTTGDAGWDSWPSKTSWNSIGYRADWKTFELAFGGIQPESWATGGEWVRDETFFDLANTNVNYSETQADFINMIAIGSQFRFKEDPAQTVYTITDVHVFQRARYEALLGSNSFSWGAYDEDPPKWKKNIHSAGHSILTPNDLFPFHARALKGPSGIQGATQAHVYTNISNDFDVKEKHKKTEITVSNSGWGTDPGKTNVVYHTCSYLRPSNYTKNWRITVDKRLKFNPVGTETEILSEQQEILLTAATAVGSGVAKKNVVGVASITGSGASNTSTNKLKVGMVLHKYQTTTLTIPAIVSSIDTVSGGFDIKFKTYDGSEDFGTGSAGDVDQIADGNTLRFAYYPANGLSKNSAKNLNFFRNGISWDISNAQKKTGTDAVGYTIEWVEERISRSGEEVLPKNPAIWETKPKETADLDIYHEASGARLVSLDLSEDSLTEFIPIGSIIEYEERPNVIPSGTLVEGVDDTNGQIILSKQIFVGNPAAIGASSSSQGGGTGGGGAAS